MGPVLAQPGRLDSPGAFVAVFVPSLTAMVGFWATLAINIPDLSRYARSQRAQVWGQLLGLPTTMALFAFIGVAVTSASALIFGQVIWDPVQLLSRVENPALEAVALVIVLLATLSTNVAANVVAPANSLANLWPSHISFARGAVIAGAVGVVLMPWRLVANPDRYFGWLVAYSALLGPVAGVLVADYWVVRRGQLDVPELYVAHGRYGQWRGPAFIALFAGILIALAGLAIPPLRWLYDYAWFVGFAIAALVYGGLARK
jgi:NCS1 family nucleobase:cation symporter-1